MHAQYAVGEGIESKNKKIYIERQEKRNKYDKFRSWAYYLYEHNAHQ